MCRFPTGSPLVLVISDNFIFLEGIKYYYRNRTGLTVNVLHFNSQASDDYFLRMSVMSLLERLPENVRFVLSFHDDRVMRLWVCEARRHGCILLNMIETPAGRVFRGVFSYLTISSRITFSQLDEWLEKIIIPPVMHRYDDAFNIIDRLLLGMDIKQISSLEDVPEKTLYTRLRIFNKALDFNGLNNLYWLKVIRLCVDYDAIFPVRPEPDVQLMYQASAVLS